jgi:hypothetical protein
MLRSGAWFAKPALTLRSAISAFTRVFDALWRVSKGEGGHLTMRTPRLEA